MRLFDRLFGRKPPAQQPGEHAMVSLVVLSSTPLDLTLESVRQALESLYPGQYLPPREEGNFVIDGAVQGAQFMVHCALPGVAGFYQLNSVPGPYTEFSDFARHMADAALRQVATAQTCWLSIDRMHGYDSSEEGAYRFIGSLLGLLAPADASVLLHPSHYAAVGFTEEIRRRLVEGVPVLP
jgi:hypothetical protein